MIKSSVEKLADPIGFEIGSSDDNTQAALLNGFCRGLHNSILESHRREMQISYLVDHLDSKAEQILLEIADFIKLKQQES